MYKLTENNVAEKIASILDRVPGVEDIQYGRIMSGDAARYRDAVRTNSRLAQRLGTDYLNNLAHSKQQAANANYLRGGAKLLGTGLAVGGAVYGGKKLYDAYKNRQEANKTAGMSDVLGYIPGVQDIREGKSFYQTAEGFLNKARSGSSGPAKGFHEAASAYYDALARRSYGKGIPKLLGTGMLTAGAVYGGKKLYDKFKAAPEADKTASAIRGLNKLAAAAAIAGPAPAIPPSLSGEIGKHLLLAGAATLGGIVVQKGFGAASSALDKLEKPKNLARMMAVAPELRAIDPQMLSLAYDSVAAISPKLVKDPLVGASVLRKHVQTTDLSALRSAADLYRSTIPTVESVIGPALARGAEKGFGSYQGLLKDFNKSQNP
jgi:hypothetical protein